MKSVVPAALALAVLNTACGGGEKTTATCVPGASVACVCADSRTGAQVCQADGTFAACSCASPTADGGGQGSGGANGHDADLGGSGSVVVADGSALTADGRTSAADVRVADALLPQLSDAGVDLVSPPSHGIRCDDLGNCYCIAIASLGQPGDYASPGATDNPNAFQAYLNAKSNAKMDVFTAKPSLTAGFLKDFDVLILQAMVNGSLRGDSTPWIFSSDEMAAVETWVKTGHAIISMSGYQGDQREVEPLNQLLKFTGISYNTDDIYMWGDSLNYCRGYSVPFDGWAAPMNYGGMKAVGLFHGRSLTCSDCDVWAQDSGGLKLGVAKGVGAGRVFAWADEWVTYTSEWGLVPKDHGAACVGHTAAEMYTVPQFWYNAIANVVPDQLKKCFKIDDVTVY